MLPLIPGAEALPIHVVRQQTIDELGRGSTKYRPCHDLTHYPLGMNKNSINVKQVDKELHAMQHSLALFRMLQFVVALRVAHPFAPILFQKFNVENAFKRLGLNSLAIFKRLQHLAI